MSQLAESRKSPYVGLEPFESAYAEYFFGRRRESKIIAASVLSRPVTVVYGPSGIGKSSILNVGLPAALEEIAATDRADAELDGPGSGAITEAIDNQFIIRGWREWQDPVNAEQQLSTWAAENIRQPVLVILDQFEEYFLYPDANRAHSLDRTLGKLAARRNSSLHLLVGVRDDAVHQLDRLRAFVPGILDSMIELRGLSDGAIAEAITEPIAVYNKKYRTADTAVTVEPGLVTALIRQLKEGDTELNKSPPSAGGAQPTGLPYLLVVMTKLWTGLVSKTVRRFKEADTQLFNSRRSPGGDRRIELPYLQLALTKLWNAEGAAAAATLRKVNALGEARRRWPHCPRPCQ